MPDAAAYIERVDAELSSLPSGTNVAVVTMTGSFCPVTQGHVLGFVEARRMLLQAGARRPAKLESFGAVLGLVSLNSDGHVDRKLDKLGLPSISYDNRRALVETAIAEHVWMGTEDRGGVTIGPLQARWPRLRFVRLLMNGADDVLKYRKWEQAGPRCRMITLGRPGDTAAVLTAATSSGIDLDGGDFIMGPDLPDISSSEARKALISGDTPRAARLLNTAVLTWCLQHGPWRPTATERSRRGGGHAGASSPPSPPGMPPTLEAVLSASPSTEVRSKATQYARTMEAAGYGDVQSLLQCDDGDLDEMRQELEANGVPQMDAASIMSMFSADALSEAIQAMSVAAPAAPSTTPVDISATPAETRLSGYCFEVEDESAPGGWLRVQDCTAAMMRVLMGDGLQQFTMSGWKKYEAFRDPATSKLKQRNCKYGVRLTRCPPCALPIC